MRREQRSRPSCKAGPVSAAGSQPTTFVDLAASIGGALLLAEIDLRTAARRIEWAAVQRPELDRTARFAFAAAQRVRGDRLVQP